VVYLLLDIGEENFRREGRRWVWDPKNTLARASISYFDTSDDCLVE
jgi:hypothetical protein